MPSHARQVLTELLAVLRTDLGDNDLSTVNSTPKVVIADGGHPPVSAPYILLSSPSVVSRYDAPLTEYHVVGDLEWFAYVGAPDVTTEGRAFAALDFADEIVTAIENAHFVPATYPTLFGLTVLIASWDQVFADEPDLPFGLSLVHGTIHYETDLPRGG